MNIIKFEISDKLLMKKRHPCGSQFFTVIRGGTDVRIKCDGCQRDLTIEREALEKMIRKVVQNSDTNNG